MHRKFQRAHLLSKQVIGAAIEVHRFVGPGLVESIYEKCMARELQLREIRFSCQEKISICYKGTIFEECLKMDIFVEDCLVVELKAVEIVLPIHKAQVLSYMKLVEAPIGILVNFHSALLKNGLSRLMLPGADGCGKIPQ